MKKILVLVGLFLYNIAISQDASRCNTIINLTTDKFTKSSFWGSYDFINFQGQRGFESARMLCVQSEDKKLHSIVIYIKGMKGCIDDKDKVQFLFEDGSNLELDSNSDFNCSGEVTIRFGSIYGKKKADTNAVNVFEILKGRV